MSTYFPSLMSIKNLAQKITENGYRIGQKQLFEYLRENGYLHTGTHHNQPTEETIIAGIFEVQETYHSRSDGRYMQFTTRVTPKGQQYFLEKFTKKST